MSEERLLTYEQMADLSRDLHAAGFRHVLALHLIDPKWRRDYRPGWADDRDVMWTVRLHEHLMPMDQHKRLIEICERHGFVIWMSTPYADFDEDTGEGQFYVRIGRPEMRGRL